MKLTKIILGVLLILSMGLQVSYADEETVDVNFRNLSVKDFVEMVSKIMQKNILIEEDLRGQVNFVSTKPIKKSSLFTLANVILGGKGLTLIDQGEFYRVVKSQNAAGEGVPVSSTIGGEDTLKTVMFPLKNSNAAVVRAKIKPLLGRSDSVISFQENNVLAITSQPRILESVSKVINAIEERGEKRSVVLKMKNSSVKDIYANAINMTKKIFPQAIESEAVDIFKDDATNSIILVGKPENNARMIKYIKQLDIKGESITQKMYVLRLKNSNVEDMEKILSQLVSQMNDVAPPAAAGKAGEKPSKAMVVSDLERNALVILATSEQMKNIRETVAQIDIPKVQVYVQARIVEINNNLAEQIGLRYGINAGSITSNGLFSGGANLGAPALLMSPELTSFLNTTETRFDSNGNAYTSTTTPFKFASDVDKLFAVGAKLDLLKQNGAAHILSEPSVLCTNNKEAEIYVGRTQSILTQAQQSTQTQGNIINNYSREDIGITLKVKPRLSSDNQVTMEVETQIEDVLPGSETAADRPTTTKRKVTTNVVVNNGEMIILGGLIKKSGGEGKSQIPVLGDIPILGEYLFSYNSTNETEENVVIYLTPYIVRKSGDLQRLRDMLSELEDVQKRYNAYVYEVLEKGDTSSGTTSNNASQRIKRAPADNLSILDAGER